MKHYIGETIVPIFKVPLPREKTPTCPDGFAWGEEELIIERSIQEWVDFGRRGKYEKNMSEPHLEAALVKGSFGVGRFFFQVVVSDGRVFEIYFDRAPTKKSKTGSWILYKQLDEPEEKNGSTNDGN